MPPRGPRAAKTPKSPEGTITSIRSDEDGGGVTTLTMENPALTPEMGAMLDGPGAQWEGAPYFDATMNYLHFKWEQVDRENSRTLDKIDKLHEFSAQCQREMTTVAALLKAEFERREIVNPNTGEKIDQPFQTYT